MHSILKTLIIRSWCGVRPLLIDSVLQTIEPAFQFVDQFSVAL